MGGVGRNRGRLAQAQHGSGVHGAGGGQRLASSVPSLSHPTSSLSLRSGHFSEGQRPLWGRGARRPAAGSWVSPPLPILENAERVRLSSCLGNSPVAHLSTLGEAAWVEPQHLFPSGEILH